MADIVGRCEQLTNVPRRACTLSAMITLESENAKLRAAAGQHGAVIEAAREYVNAVRGIRWLYSEDKGEQICSACGSYRRIAEHYDRCPPTVTFDRLAAALENDHA